MALEAMAVVRVIQIHAITEVNARL
jgi:hypothetical protein